MKVSVTTKQFKHSDAKSEFTAIINGAPAYEFATSDNQLWVRKYNMKNAYRPAQMQFSTKFQVFGMSNIQIMVQIRKAVISKGVIA